MKFKLSVLLLPVVWMTSSVDGMAAGKFVAPTRVPIEDLAKEPYRYNGVIRLGPKRGSAFCAWNAKTYFSAANRVFENGIWGPAPIWNAVPDAPNGTNPAAIRTRGYYRWTDYSELVDLGKRNAAFGKDVILGFAFKPLIDGKPAVLNLRGYRDLSGSSGTLITTYPATHPATGDLLENFALYQVETAEEPYQVLSGRAMTTSLVVADSASAGGPVWIRGSGGYWRASGVLVGRTPTDSVVCAFSPETKSLQRAVFPVIDDKPRASISVKNVDASSMYFPYSRRHKIPDGVQKWTNFKRGVKPFAKDAQVGMVRLSLEITTSHRGDLQVILSGPGGVEAVVHDGQGGDARDLVITDRDLTEFFTGIKPNGTWVLRVQDRTKGDQAFLESFRLEIAAAQDDGDEPM